MKKLFPIILVLTFLLSACADYTQEEVDSMVSSTSSTAYEEGFLDGRFEGQQAGYEEGHDLGFEEGYYSAEEEMKDEFAQTQNYWLDLLRETPPKTVALLYESDSESQTFSFQVQNSSDLPVVIRVVQYGIDTASNLIADYYLSAHSGTACMAFEGDCEIFVATGHGDWYGRKVLWFDATKCYKFNETLTFSNDSGGSYYATIDNDLDYASDISPITLEEYAAPDPNKSVSQYFAEPSQEETSSKEEVSSYEELMPIENGAIVYWVPNGKSYHASEYCRTLNRSKTIISGTIDEAIASGHGDPCDVCY